MELLDRIVELRGQSLSFQAIADFLSEQDDKHYTKDSVQKIYQRTADRPVRRIVVVSDIHAYPDEKLTQAILAEKPEGIVVAGDLFDAAQFSCHPRNLNEDKKAFRQEMDIVRAWLKLISEQVKWVKIMYGNHELRLYAILAEILPDDVIEMLPDILEMAAKGLENVEIVHTPTILHFPNGDKTPIAETQFMCWIGDCLISHANFCGSKPGLAVDKLYNWVQEWRRPLGWEEPTLYVQTHVHKLSYAERQGGHSILVENGMAGNPASEKYKTNYDLKWASGTLGAVVFDQELSGSDWKTKRDTVELIRPRR